MTLAQPERTAPYIDWGQAFSMSRTSVTDTKKNWEANVLAGHLVRFQGGSNDGAIAIIASNDAQSFQLVSQLAASPGAPVSTYYFILTDKVDGLGAIAGSTADAIKGLGNTLDEMLLVLKQIRLGINLQLGLSGEKTELKDTEGE